MLENQVYEQGLEYIFMKENKTVDKTFVTSASMRVNYLYKIINVTVLVYSSAVSLVPEYMQLRLLIP